MSVGKNCKWLHSKLKIGKLKKIKLDLEFDTKQTYNTWIDTRSQICVCYIAKTQTHSTTIVFISKDGISLALTNKQFYWVQTRSNHYPFCVWFLVLSTNSDSNQFCGCLFQTCSWTLHTKPAFQDTRRLLLG